MKILITGGAGFIGKHIVNDLLKRGNVITVFDNFSNSEKRTLSFNSKNIKIIEGDITKFDDIFNAIEDQEVVIHLAAKISVEESNINPAETFHVNIDGTKNVLFACEKNHVKKLVVASSAAVYGEGLPNVKLVENSKINPISPYGESKAIMEQEIKKFISKHHINCDILRFFNIFGYGQTSEYAGVITKFIQKIKNNQPLVIFGEGTQTRDFVAIQDIANAIEKSILKMDKKNGIYNIASGKSTSIRDLAELMISFTGKNLGIKFLPSKKGDIKFSQTDITLAKKELGYSSKYGLDEIQKLIVSKDFQII